MWSIADPPPRSALARFDPGFGQRFLLTVDTQAELAPDEQLTRDGYRPEHIDRLAEFQQFCESERVLPAYLVDGTVARSARAAEILRGPLAAGKAEIGVRFNPRVSPPFDEEPSPGEALAGHLPRTLEQAKFASLRDEIERSFGIAPAICRAGPSGLGPNLPDMLIDGAVAIDSSVRARFDCSAPGGPDFRYHPPAPYWLDDGRRLLELPATAVFWGLLRKQGAWLYPASCRAPSWRKALARLGLLERIALSPEGIDVDEAIRSIDMALDDGLPLLVFSFDSLSLRPGATPFVRSEDDLADWYDWWRRVFAYLELRKVLPTTVSGVLRAVQR